MITQEHKELLQKSLKCLNGLNEFDLPFVQKMVNIPSREWTPNQTRLVYLIVQRYEEQLKKLGIDWEEIIIPDHVSKDKLDNYPRVIFYDDNKRYGYDKITVKMPYDDSLINKFKSEFGSLFEWSPKTRVFLAFSINEMILAKLIQFASENEFEMYEDLILKVNEFIGRKNDINWLGSGLYTESNIIMDEWKDLLNNDFSQESRVPLPPTPQYPKGSGIPLQFPHNWWRKFINQPIKGVGKIYPDNVVEHKQPTYQTTEQLSPLINQINTLMEDTGHQERAHESLVEQFYELLGFYRHSEIKFQQGRVDITIKHNEQTLIVNEVKRDWDLSYNDKKVIKQAFGYALENGARYVVISNGDYYAIFDRYKGLTYESCFMGDFKLTRLSKEGLELIKTLRKESLQT